MTCVCVCVCVCLLEALGGDQEELLPVVGQQQGLLRWRDVHDIILGCHSKLLSASRATRKGVFAPEAQKRCKSLPQSKAAITRTTHSCHNQ
jgi:hypothetical protein